LYVSLLNFMKFVYFLCMENTGKFEPIVLSIMKCLSKTLSMVSCSFFSEKQNKYVESFLP